MEKDTDMLSSIVNKFLLSADSGMMDDVIAIYDEDFKNIRVVDDGTLVNMDRQQMIHFWKVQTGKIASGTFGVKPLQIVTGNTTIHYIKIVGDTGYVILTRLKDLGSGSEKIFYNLVWKLKSEKWYLLREFVHQRNMPKLK